jgi:hypothetical protein
MVLGSASMARADECPVGLPGICECTQLDTQKVAICVPPPGDFNGTIAVYAHGYIYPQEGPVPPALPSLPLEEMEEFIPPFLEAGFGVATTGYSVNGYAVEQAGDDLDALAVYIDSLYPSATKILVGASEGAIIGTMMLEQYDHFDGGLALCGPIGGMTEQLEYIGDFRVLFDYFFPWVFPVGLHQYNDSFYDEVCTETEEGYVPWYYTYVPRIEEAIRNHPLRTLRLFSMTKAAFDFCDSTSFEETARIVLKYSVCGAKDLVLKAGGMPYNNIGKWYPGSLWLNLLVDRVNGDAQSYVSNHYDPTGSLTVPMVTLHNLFDPAVPYRHEGLYKEIVEGSGYGHNLTILPTLGYGHCEFKPWQVLGAFYILLNQVNN